MEEEASWKQGTIPMATGEIQLRCYLGLDQGTGSEDREK